MEEKEQRKQNRPEADREESFASLLLMGGKSSRMGTSKALLTLEGKTFFQRITDQMALLGPVYVSVDLAEHVPPCPYQIVEDQVAEAGPLGGLSAAFSRIREDVVFVCACDMPFMSAEYIRFLQSLIRPEDMAVLVQAKDGRIHMMGGLYRRDLAGKMQELLAQGKHRLKDLIADLPVRILQAEEIGEYQSVLRNVNTPGDYQELLRTCGQEEKS